MRCDVPRVRTYLPLPRTYLPRTHLPPRRAVRGESVPPVAHVVPAIAPRRVWHEVHEAQRRVLGLARVRGSGGLKLVVAVGIAVGIAVGTAVGIAVGMW